MTWLRIFKAKCFVHLLFIVSFGGLSLYSLKALQEFHSQSRESRGGCKTDVHSPFGQMIRASPEPFFSKSDEVAEEAFKWWKPIQGSKENFTFFKMTVEKTFQMIPPTIEVFKPTPQKCRTCAVVGNSGHLIGSRYGPLIDFHDFVIRMNRGVTKGYEIDVGARTTHRVMYPESATRVDNTTHLLFFPYKIRDFEWLRNTMRPADGIEKRIQRDVKVTYLSPAFMKYVFDTWLNKKGGYGSTGFMAVILSLVICDEVSVFGFGADGDGNWSHYFERFKYSKLGTGLHQGKLEYSTYEKLNEMKKIRFFKKL